MTSPTPVPGSLVSVELEALEETASEGREIVVLIRINAGEANPVDAAQVYLDFDESRLEMIALKPGGKLRFVLQNETSNASGRIGYAAGTTGQPATNPFTLCSITFRGRAPENPEETAISFAPLQFPRHTKVVYRGLNVTGELVPALLSLR